MTAGTPAALAARHATETIPIVMAASGAPSAEGIVASLARPGGNVTGFHTMAPSALGGERPRLLKEAVPGLARIALLWGSRDLHALLAVRETERAAQALGVQLTSVGVRRPDDLERAFETVALAPVDALIAIEGPLTIGERARIVGFATMSRLPAIDGLREFVEAGGLMAYGTDRRDLFRRAAASVHRILEGARPADMPVERPTAFALVARQRADGLVVVDDSVLVAHTRRLGQLSAARSLPGVGGIDYAEGGGLLTYGVDFPALWRRAPYFVDRVLRGAAAATIPVERASTFTITVNLAAARALGLTLPPALLYRADRVVQ